MGFLRRLWHISLFAAVGLGAGFMTARLSGAPEAALMAPGVIAGGLVPVFPGRACAEFFLRWATGRHHPDYARIAEMERELGLGDPPEPEVIGYVENGQFIPARGYRI